MTDQVRLPLRQPNYITSYLSPEALKDIANWEKAKNQPCLVKAFDHAYPQLCKNCTGLGFVYISFCSRGPYLTPSNNLKKISTWFDGDHKYKRGWYTIAETRAYPCPECESGEDGTLREVA